MTATERGSRNGVDEHVAVSEFVTRSDVQRALDAGFSREDVAYMLALPNPEQWDEDTAPRAAQG